MARKKRISLICVGSIAPLAFWLIVSAAVSVAGQVQIQEGSLKSVEKQVWRVFGRVTTLNGQPVAKAVVIVDIGMGADNVQTLETNLRGEFGTEYNLDKNLSRRLIVRVVAKKDGFQDAEETADFGAAGKTWEIEVLMREENPDSDQLPLATLTNDLVPQILQSAGANRALDPVRAEFARGVKELLDRRNPAKAPALLAETVERQPECVECRALLGLALLKAGSYASAKRELAEAAEINSSRQSGEKTSHTLLILGVLASWRGEDKEAAGYLKQALDLDPNNPLILQELGRALVFQKNWEAADLYLERAVKAGASSQSRLLRAHALLEEGDVEGADAEMTLYLEGSDIKDFPLRTRSFYAQLQIRQNLKSFGKVKSVTDEPISQLLEKLPELRGMKEAVSQEPLASILSEAGKSVEAFFRNFQNTISLEQIREEKVGKDGKTTASLDEGFQYLLLSRPEEGGMALEEYRTNSRGDRVGSYGLQRGFMLTSGFASISLHFHPAYQAGSKFRYLGRQWIGSQDCFVVAFSQSPETAQVIETFKADQARVLVLLQGLAWIDTKSHHIIRLRTDLLKPISEIRLHRQTTEIEYGPVQFREAASILWLPRNVAVTVAWKGKTFHNLHRYSEFKLFNIATQEKLKPLQSRGQVPAGLN